MAKPVLDKYERSHWFFIGRNFCHTVRTFSMETVMSCVFFFSANLSKAKEQLVNRCCKGKMIEKINLTEI